MIFHLNKQTGFSLVETLVSISILLIVIVGPMTISSQTAKSATFASEQVQAFFLAQEGVELAQVARDDLILKYFDNPVLANEKWTEFIDSTGSGVYTNCFKSTGCGLEWNFAGTALDTPKNCVTTTNCLLRQATRSSYSDRSMFNHRATNIIDNPETIFKRQIFFSTSAPLDSTREVSVRSVVTWRTGSLVADQKVEIDTYLYNVYETP
jgi:type II secretory pathway pseudopilin PulG